MDKMMYWKTDASAETMAVYFTLLELYGSRMDKTEATADNSS